MNGEKELRRLFESADALLPGQPLDWNETIVRARRARLARLVAAGAVAAAIVAGGIFGASVLRNEASPEPLPPAGPSPSPTPAESPDPDDRPPEEGVSVRDAIPTVERFLAAASRGNAAGMWEQMSRASKVAFDDDLAAFEDFVRQGVSEGLGSWHFAEDRGFDLELFVSSGDGALGVVTVLGHRVPEGNDEPFAIFPIPIRIDGTDDAMVELWVDESPNPAEFVRPKDLTPSARARVDSKRPMFEALVPASATDVYMLAAPVAGEPAARESGVVNLASSGADTLSATWRPSRETLFPAEWFLTVFVVHDDGTIGADATRFIVD